MAASLGTNVVVLTRVHCIMIIIILHAIGILANTAVSSHHPRSFYYIEKKKKKKKKTFVETDHEIFSTVILPLPLIQEGPLSVSVERMCIVVLG